MRPVASLLALLAACSGAPASGGSTTGASLAGGAGEVSDAEVRDADRFVEAYRSALCARGVACEPRWSSVPDANATACHPEYRETIWADRIAAWRAGRSRYDAAAATRCLAWLRSGQCDVFYDDDADAACSRVLAPTVDEGGACSRRTDLRFPGVECVAGLVCALGDECPGRCVRPAAAGERCDEAVPCANDLECDANGRCVAQPARSEPCEKALQCGGGLVCVDGHCADGGAPGAHCTWARPCRRGLNCWLESFDEDAVGVCNEYALDEGQPCLGGEMVDSCRPNLVCEMLPDSPYWGRCGAGAAIGAACAFETPCAVGGRCIDGACRRIVAPDQPCGEHAVCPLSHTCQAGRCTPLPGPGDACGDAGCYLTECVDGTCAPADPVLGGDRVCP